MSRFRTTGEQFAIRICYLLPLLSGALLLIPALVPHIFFLQDSSLSATVNVFDLLGSIRAQASNLLHAESGSVASSTYYFALLMSVLTAVSWFFTVWYALFAVASAAVSVWAFGAPPSAALNTAKRVYRILVPNRVFYGVFCALPLLPALMPYLYAHFLRTMLGTAVSVHFYGAPDFVYTLLALLICAVPFYAWLPAQKRERMDLFRIYKVR